MIAHNTGHGQSSSPELPGEPTYELIQRAWARGPHASRVLRWAARLHELTPRERALFAVALRLEEGDLPWIEQHGFARFDPADAADHRLITVQAEKGEGQSLVERDTTQGSASRAAERSTGRCAEAEAQEAEARPPVRGPEHERRTYLNVGEVMDEDRWELGAYFPGFSPPIFDFSLGMFFREGMLQPLRWWPAQFAVRLYYEHSPWLLPIVRIAPEPPPNVPHMFRMTRNGVQFRAVCYTFAPDGTIARGRSWEDTAAEILRQVVVWLLRYIVWQQFDFFPGVDVGHDPAELLSRIGPADPCPYHADRPYGRCCRPRHQAEILRRRRAKAANSDLRYGILDPGARGE